MPITSLNACDNKRNGKYDAGECDVPLVRCKPRNKLNRRKPKQTEEKENECISRVAALVTRASPNGHHDEGCEAESEFCRAPRQNRLLTACHARKNQRHQADPNDEIFNRTTDSLPHGSSRVQEIASQLQNATQRRNVRDREMA